MKQYSRVSYATRCQIFALMQAQKSIPEIARLLGFHKSTIYRELKRNQGLEITYRPDKAEFLSRRRYALCRKRRAITTGNKDLILKLLKFGLSPEVVAGRLRRENGAGPSHQTLYNYIKYAGLKGHLKTKGKRGAGRYTQRKRIRRLNYGHKIKDRPQIANKRGRIGDWERDTMHTKNGVQLLVCQDRKSRFIKVDIVKKRTTYEIGKLTLKLIKEAGRKLYTLTNDNGGDFKGKCDLGVRTYFCDPMSPHQRGSVERVIKSIREYIKRDTDVTNYRKKDFKEIEDKLNNRPRKVLDYQTPSEVFFGKKVAMANLI